MQANEPIPLDFFFAQHYHICNIYLQYESYDLDLSIYNLDICEIIASKETEEKKILYANIVCGYCFLHYPCTIHCIQKVV